MKIQNIYDDEMLYSVQLLLVVLVNNNMKILKAFVIIPNPRVPF
jgi:hypothetical protein